MGTILPSKTTPLASDLPRVSPSVMSTLTPTPRPGSLLPTADTSPQTPPTIEARSVFVQHEETAIVGPAVYVPTQIPNRSIGEIATDFEEAVHALEDLYTSGDAHYLVWLKKNEERLRAQANRDLTAETAERAKEVSRLQSELTAASTALSRRFADVRSKL